MSFEVRTTPNFDREAKRLAKKWSSLKDDLANLFSELAKNPTQGTHLGQDVYKIRLRITSQGKGKSRGARVISFVHVTGERVYPVSIYSKGERDSISDKEIRQLVKDIVIED
ncbi:MAG: type II toxin-antitoxin system RelE/ParE family toxin [Flavobacteriales bacterium]|nr:type II toxin-antitoxin system RelE/ParE family toxin [Flavobacteriales bacterium]